jgi:hypothetical protein
MLLKLMKMYIMMLMVVWVAAIVSAMVSGGMMMGKKMRMHRMKGMWKEKMGQMQEKACEEMEKEKEPSI